MTKSKAYYELTQAYDTYKYTGNGSLKVIEKYNQYKAVGGAKKSHVIKRVEHLMECWGF